MLRALRKPILGAAGLAVAAASLAFALPCNDALAAESVARYHPPKRSSYSRTCSCRTRNPQRWRDVVGDPTYNKLTVCFLLSDPSPKFRLTNEGSNGASWVSLSTSALTAIVPPSPTKSATIAN